MTTASAVNDVVPSLCKLNGVRSGGRISYENTGIRAYHSFNQCGTFCTYCTAYMIRLRSRLADITTDRMYIGE